MQENNLGLDVNGTHQILVYGIDINIIDDNIKTIGRNAEVLLNACKDIVLAVNTGKPRSEKERQYYKRTCHAR